MRGSSNVISDACSSAHTGVKNNLRPRIFLLALCANQNARAVTHTNPQVGSIDATAQPSGLILADLEGSCFTNIWKKDNERLIYQRGQTQAKP